MTQIDAQLVHQLISEQFPQWKDLPISPVFTSGWDNRTFHLGLEMLVRIPSRAEYAEKVAIEQKWLPILAPHLPLPIPEPIALGQPSHSYAWNWSIYRWIKGESASTAPISDLNQFARDLAHFLSDLHRIKIKDGPLPGPHNFYRGGALKTYDSETRRALSSLKSKIDVDQAKTVWEEAIVTSWQKPPVWVHGDISAGNLLVRNGKLAAVIDFGGLAIGDPACDLAIAWTLFHGESRKIFEETLQLDLATWARGRAWTLWKALIVAAGFCNPSNKESKECWRVIDDLLTDK